MLAVTATVALSVFTGGCSTGGKKNMWFEHSTKKILSGYVNSAGKDSYTLYLSRNEYEGCQIAVNPDETYDDFSFEISGPDGVVPGGGDIAEGISVELFSESFLRAPKYYPFFQVSYDEEGKYEEYPDALAPLTGSVTVRRMETTPFYVLVHARPEASAGEYEVSITAKAGDNVIGSCRLTVHVWDFTLPETPSLSAVAGLGVYDIARVTETKDNDELQLLYEKYYDFLAEHKISPYSLPYDVLDGRADKFMDDPRVTGFKVEYGNDDYILAVREKLLSKPGRVEKAYFYFLDEPSTPEAYEHLVSKSRHLLELFPEARIVSPFFVDPDMYDGRDAVEYSFDSVNIWCAKLHCFDVNNPNNIYSDLQNARLASLKDRLAERRAMGEDVWTYVCWEPGEPYLNLYVNMPGIRHRLIFWQNYLVGANGFLYWSSTYWSKVSDPWSDMSTVKNLSPNVFGDGSLLYNGSKVGVFGACSSLRLEMIRDGIDDYEYFAMLENLGVSRDELLKIVSRLSPSLTEYTSDDDLLYRVRIMLGDMIEKLTERGKL